MKNIISFLLLFASYCAFGQSWYSKIFDPFNGKQELATKMVLVHDTLYIRARTICSTGDKLCTLIGRFSPDQNQFIDIKHFDNIQSGGENLLIVDEKLVLSSEESILNQNISLSQVKKSSLDYINTIDLKIDDDKYSGYTIKSSIIYRDKIFVGSQVLNNEIFIDYPGWHGPQEHAVFFILDKTLQLDTILIIPPSSGAFLKIEDLAIGPDSILYISFYERYLKSGTSQDYLEMRKVVYGFDKSYNIIFHWIGPDFETQESLSYIAISQDTTIYLNFKRSYQTFLAALRPDGSTKWECLLDSTILSNLYNIRKIILADNGDIIGAGVISSVIDELGESGFLFRIDSLGNLKWKRAIRVNKGFDLTVPKIFPYQTGLEDLIELPGGDLLAIGYVRRFVDEDPPDGPYNFDIWMVRTSAEGCLWEDCPYIQDVITKPQYIPIVTSKNEWVVDVYSDFWPDRIVRNTFSEDSILIDGEYYFQLLYSSEMSGPWEPTGVYFREENGKVFTIGGAGGPTKKLIYDFDFIIGDTLLPHEDGFPNHREIVQVGGIQLMDSVQRKFLTLECTTNIVNGSTTWIEGMGDVDRRFWTESFCSAIDGHGSYNSIRCFSTGGQLLYLRPDLEGCYTTAINNLETESLHVFPNPNSGTLHFDFRDEHIMERILIYDSVGKLVLTSNQHLLENNLDISHLASGLYFGTVYFKDNTLKAFKIVLDK